MMAEPKTFASLSSGLLARKGAAKPAMRPQGFGQMGVSMEDLGWNDMGQSQPYPEPQQEMPEHVPSSIAALTPAPRLHSEPAPKPAPQPAPPPVVEQQRAIEETFAPKPAPAAPKAVKAIRPAPVRAPEPRPLTAKAKAAFTLRLDPERHLKLRLACALTNRSAQQIVTEALDGFLGSIPELDAFANQMPAARGKKN
jgi:septal ring-binding cell division protein DamX